MVSEEEEEVDSDDVDAGDEEEEDKKVEEEDDEEDNEEGEDDAGTRADTKSLFALLYVTKWNSHREGRRERCATPTLVTCFTPDSCELRFIISSV